MNHSVSESQSVISESQTVSESQSVNSESQTVSESQSISESQSLESLLFNNSSIQQAIAPSISYVYI